MKKVIGYIILSGIIFSSCNNNEKEARARLDNARKMYEANEFFAAKNEIDSVRVLYPKEFNVLKEGINLMRLVEKKEAERTLAYCDSLMPIRLTEIEALRKDFVFEKDSVYEEIGTYIWKQQTIERNINRCYIRCGVNEKGEMYLASVYYGNTPINHTSIKLSTPSGLFAETATIPYDGGVNYRFKDEGAVTEVVTYKGEAGLDAINLIFNNTKERIKVEYTGGKPYIIYIADADKKALVATYNLGTVLSDINHMTTEMNKAQGRLEYLEKKLNTNETK
ncbi:hypothetical protein [Massilibacteroides sp.]|uniref:hypothetical protein n=1 Tax=Massilibacteroides sp. TaxID=2034766 RepID=UPI0026337E4E|nr:hypothetical protein [Massilibacteroides sp.]MDD4514332.1 hypothetical protein [Massilibacteroides sp.]